VSSRVSGAPWARCNARRPSIAADDCLGSGEGGRCRLDEPPGAWIRRWLRLSSRRPTAG